MNEMSADAGKGPGSDSKDASPAPAPARSNRAAMMTVFFVVVVDLLGFGIVLPLLPVTGPVVTTVTLPAVEVALMALVAPLTGPVVTDTSPLTELASRPLPVVGATRIPRAPQRDQSPCPCPAPPGVCLGRRWGL